MNSDLIDNVEANRKPLVLVIIFCSVLFYSSNVNHIYKSIVDTLSGMESVLLATVGLSIFSFIIKPKNMIFWIAAGLVMGGICMHYEDSYSSLPRAFLDSVIFISVYFYASRYFNPDLDQDMMRPGMSSFPFGKRIAHLAPLLPTLLWPINRAWYHFWGPYGALLTHRGVSHWPIIGTYTRVFYIGSMLFLIDYLLLKYGYPSIGVAGVFRDKGFFGLLAQVTSFDFILLISPIILSDINHFIVDAFDSARKGSRFCPYGLKRGLIVRTFMR